MFLNPQSNLCLSSAHLCRRPDGLRIHTQMWFPGAGFLGAPPISLIHGGIQAGRSPRPPPIGNSHTLDQLDVKDRKQRKCRVRGVRPLQGPNRQGRSLKVKPLKGFSPTFTRLFLFVFYRFGHISVVVIFFCYVLFSLLLLLRYIFTGFSFRPRLLGLLP